MDDVIYRQHAINAIENTSVELSTPDWDELTDAIMAVPSAWRKGHWLKVSGYATPGGDPVWACSECGKGLHTYGIEHGSYGTHISDGQWVACPNCGADMRGEEN